MNQNMNLNMKRLKKIPWTLIFCVVGIVFSIICRDNLGMGIILTILATLLAALVEWYIKYEKDKTFYNNEFLKLEHRLEEISNQISYTNQITTVEHPYFKKEIDEKMKEFLSDNQELLSGIHVTNPHADDTFGIEGISYTKEFGSIKAVSSIPDYWEDDFTKEYLKVQSELIDQKHVTIQRIFIFEKKEWKKKEQHMKEQVKCGIQVFYIDKDSEYFNPQWMQEDFLIQDNELLVDIAGITHKFNKNDSVEERITMNKNEVQQKLKRFDRLLERATEYKC